MMQKTVASKGAPENGPRSAWVKAAGATKSPADGVNTAERTKRKLSVQWSLDQTGTGDAVHKSPTKITQMQRTPRTVNSGNGATDFRQNVLEFLRDMYGANPLDDQPVNNTSTGTPSPGKQEQSNNDNNEPNTLTTKHPPTPSLANANNTPSAGPQAPKDLSLRRAVTHNCIHIGRPPLLTSRQPLGKSVTGDHLGTLLDHIVEGYKRRSAKGEIPVQSPKNDNKNGDVLSRYVSLALDSFLVREASFSGADLASSASFLSAGGDRIFSKLVSFQALSQVALQNDGVNDDESETLIKPVFEGKMATFDPMASCAAGASVSKSLPLGGEIPPPVAEVEPPVSTEEPAVRRREAPTANVSCGGVKAMTGPRSSFSRKMSLDSAGLNAVSQDSWAEVDDGENAENVGKKAMNVSVSKGNGKQDHLNPLESSSKPLASFARSLIQYTRSSKTADPQADMADRLSQLVSDEELKRSVFVAVERRFRTYLSSLEKEGAAEKKNQSTAPKGGKKMEAATRTPMVQNLLDFFGN